MKDLKILQVNTVCGSGSVGRIVVDLYKIIEEAGGMPLVSYGRGLAPEGIQGFLIGNKPDFYRHVLRNFFCGESGFGSEKVTRKFIAWLKQEKPDVIHLHNIHGFYLQVELLFAYLKEAGIPVVWTLHDCWPFTGHCAYFDYVECSKWKTGCRDCEQHAKSYPYAIFKDNSIESYHRKRAAFCGVPNLWIVTPSKWLAELVRQSFLKEYPVEVIPNGIDLTQFKPTVSEQLMEHFKPLSEIGVEKKVILGVANIWEARKGLTYFERLAKELPENYQIVLVGVSQKQQKALQKQFGSERFLALIRTENTKQLAALYTRADLYVNATLEDNFPTTNLEALACKTPVLTFETGGSGESLNEQCGKCVPKGDFEALKEAVLSMNAVKEQQQKQIRKACLVQAEKYDKQKRFKTYLQLYDKIRK